MFISTGFSFGQEFGFGFGDSDSEDTSSGSGSGLSSGFSSKTGLSVKLGGEIAFEITPYVHDFRKKDSGDEISFWDMASSKFNFSLLSSNFEAYTAFNFNYAAFYELGDGSLKLSDTPLLIDEAYLRAYIGPVNIEAGFRKLTWGKADSLGPLDVTNPLDYTDLRNISDIKSIKIARPMIHLTWNTGNFSKLEGVFIPNFTGHRFADKGRWRPAQYDTMTDNFTSGASGVIFARANEKYSSILGPLLVSNPDLIDSMTQKFASGLSEFKPPFPDTSTLNYFQTGLRYTTTIGPVDIGAQYYYGNLFNPAVAITNKGIDAFLDDIMPQITNPEIDPDLLDPVKYNRYHQIGFDYAQVVFGFNIRAEFAVFLTKDLKGDDGSVQNPFIGWSVGFDRDLPWGIYANLQCNETIRLLNSKVGDNPVLDCEAGTDVTSTRITAQLSKKYLRDTLESKITVIWDIEKFDYYIIPAVVWAVGGLATELSAGIFAGKDNGDLGHYWKNTFLKLGIKYSF